MKKMKKSWQFKAMLAFVLVALFGFSINAIAQGNDGEIVLSKTATKLDIAEDNLEKGRFANVNLKINANPYKESTFTSGKLDIVLVLDGSGSMAWGPNGQYDTTTPNRLNGAKSAAKDFVNTLMDDTGNVQIGFVEFGSNLKNSQAITADKTRAINFIDSYTANGGTNLQSGINKANELLNNSTRDDAKKIVIILTDGIPTYFNGEATKWHDSTRYGNGGDDEPVAVEKICKNQGWFGCTEWQTTKTKRPSEAAKEELDNLKTHHNTADVYTITFGNESEAAAKLATINPEKADPLYKNYTALTGEDLKKKFEEIVEQTKNIIGKNSVVTDIIPKEFKLTEAAKTALEAQGVTVEENIDGTTKLTWNIGEIEAGSEKNLTYQVRADDNYHGSMFTNDKAILTTKVEEENPFYDKTDLTLEFAKPSVEIPAITNDDHYDNNESYVGYEGEAIKGATILTNDLDKNIKNDIGTSLSSVQVSDSIEIVTNNNTIKNIDGTYSIYKDGTYQGKLSINDNGTFTFTPDTEVTGEVTFDYLIKTTINEHHETEFVYSNTSTVTLLINPKARISIEGTKTWNDNDNQDGIRPEKITVTLTGTVEDKVVFSENYEVSGTGNSWDYSFTDLLKYQKGHENDSKYLIKYTITEKTVDGYIPSVEGNNITNTHEVAKTTYTLTKVWDDNGNQDGVRPDKITVTLTGTVEDEEVVFSKDYEVSGNVSDNNWNYTIKNLDKYYNGKEIVYSITEKTVDGYTTEVEENTITNTHEVEKTTYELTKIWNDNSNQDGLRPDKITVTLTGTVEDEEVVFSKDYEVSGNVSDNNWNYTIKNLDKYYNGKEIVYSITEKTVDGYTTEVEENTITNTHEVEKTTYELTKIWNDNSNQDGLRPDKITVTLTGTVEDEEVVFSKDYEVSGNVSDNNWNYTINNLDKYYNGKEIVYSITEKTVDGYTTEVEENTITNTHEVEKTTYELTKIWNDNSNQDGIRPDKITVTLTGTVDEEVVFCEDYEVSGNVSDNNWNYTINNLDKYYNGKEIVYSITEKTVDGYATTINGDTITNTHETEKTVYTVTKIWNDNSNQDGLRPENITVTLTGTVEDEVVFSEDYQVSGTGNNWTYTIENLDKYYNGKVITYTISENPVEGYQGVVTDNKITNTHTPITHDIMGKKVWLDEDNKDGLRPDSITVELYADGIATGKTVVVNADTNWEYTFTGLDTYKEGNVISYTVREKDYENMDKYTTTYDEENPFIIINTHEVKEKEITVTKVWDDKDNKYGHSNTIEVTLNGKVGEVDVIGPITVTISEEDNWTYTYTGLPEYSNGKLITYTVSEKAILDYSTEISGNEEEGFVITNTYEPTTIDIKGNKTWNDNDNQDGIRPENITVNLLDNNKDIVATATVTGPDWSFEFKNVVKYANGEEINYTIEEEAVEGYEPDINNDGLDFEIINTHTPETVTYSVTKTWNDLDNNDGIRPDSITVRLFADGIEIQSQVISASNNWTYTFANLPKYNQGKEIVYEIVEDVVKGYEDVEYTTKVNDDNTTEVIITNNHEAEKTEITVNKIWNDYNNNMNTRPDYIIVHLYANGELIATVKITEEMGWTYTFKDLLKFKDGEAIEYRIEEEKVEGYDTIYSNYDIINTYINVGVGEGEIMPPKTGNINNNIGLEFILLICSIGGLVTIGRKRESN